MSNILDSLVSIEIINWINYYHARSSSNSFFTFHAKVRSQADDEIGIVMTMEQSLRISVKANWYSYKKA